MRTDAEIKKEQKADLQRIAGFPEGRRFLLRMLDDACGLNKSVMRSNSRCHENERLIYNGAKQDVGQWLKDEVEAAAPGAIDLARGEARARAAMEGGGEEKKSEGDADGQ